MKSYYDKWRNFLKEEKWSDFEHPKDQWVDMSPTDIVNARDPVNIDLSDELFQLIDNAYRSIGGNYEFKTPADIPGQSDYWIATDIDQDPEPDVVRVGKTKDSGVKLSASGHDGTANAKDAYIAKTAELLKQPGHYAEMSKAIAHIMITRYGAPYVEDPEKVQQVLGADKPIRWIGPHPEGKYEGYNGWYARTIKGHEGEMKIMLGNPR